MINNSKLYKMLERVNKERRNKEGKSDFMIPPKPDEKEFKEKLGVETKKIEDLREKLNSLTSKIEQTSGGKDEYLQNKNKIRSEIDEINTNIENLQKRRTELSELYKKKQSDYESVKQQVNNLKRNLGISKEEDISKEMKKLEYQMMTTTMSLKDEKRILAKIQHLNQTRNVVMKLNSTNSQKPLNEDASASK